MDKRESNDTMYTSPWRVCDMFILVCVRPAARDPVHRCEGGQDVHSQSDSVHAED